MVVCGFAFVLSVLTFFTFYRYIHQQNEFFQQLSAVHSLWMIFYLPVILIVIHCGSLLTREVLIHSNQQTHAIYLIAFIVFSRAKEHLRLYMISSIVLLMCTSHFR